MATKETKMNTGRVRFSYLHAITPQTAPGSTREKYSVQLLIPKSDTQTVNKIKACIKNAIDNDRAGSNKLRGIQEPKHPLHDGDKPSPTGKAYSKEAKGCWVMNASSNVQPGLVGPDGNTDLNPQPHEWYSGIYGRANVNFYAYSANGNAGIACGLNHLKKLENGEALGGAGNPEDAFNDGFVAAEGEDFLI